ncbi:MAG: hypothetical protein JXQ67_06045 [Campylobacterales bacterium]|nr:hypothetical protein [Campylobacterales bacterium]
MKIRAAFFVLFFVLFTIVNAGAHVLSAEHPSATVESQLIAEEGADDIELSYTLISPNYAPAFKSFHTSQKSYSSSRIIYIDKPPK